MSYIKQNWNGYDDSLTVEQNAANGAVATPEAMNHIEEGIYKANKPFIGGTVTVAEEGAPLSVEVTEDKVINIVVPAGTPGEKGQDGLDGLDGRDGANGKSTYELAVESGYEGTQAEWLASLKGADGAAGEKGEPGQDGAPGADGKDAVIETDVFEITTDMWTAVSEDEGARVKAEIVDETIGASSVVIIAVEPMDQLVAVEAGMTSLVAVETGKFHLLADRAPTSGVGLTYAVLNPVEVTTDPTV